MVIQTGIDLVEMQRIKKSLEKPRFLTRFFSHEEIELFQIENIQDLNNINTRTIEKIAGNFCVKEAFSKAIGTGIRNFALKEVSVLRDELGKPYLKLSANAKEIAKDFSFSVSITHTKLYANAVVVAYKNH